MQARPERLIFFGTPEFAVPTLAALCDSGRRPVSVVTQPDRPRGRGKRVREPPIATWARQENLPVLQPEDVRASSFLTTVAELGPTVAVVVAFGQIFPRQLLDLPRHGCINVHASLLPRYRGAAPVQAALIAGDRVTGVTTMLMEEGLDTGPILLQEETPIGDEETAGELAPRLAEIGAGLLIETLEKLSLGTLEPRRQDDSVASVARRLRREDGVVDWRHGAERIFNLLRGLTPWPGLSTRVRGERIKIHWGRPDPARTGTEVAVGTYLGLVAGRLQIACGPGPTFAIERLQRSGRQPVGAAEFVNGLHLEPGETFG